jgi:hypothetical protein
MTRRMARALALVLLVASPCVALADVPVQIRVIKGSKSGPAGMAPELEHLKRQLSVLAYVRWEQASAEQRQFTKGKAESVKLPNGDEVTITMRDESKDKVTFEVMLLARKAQSWLTVEKGQRIVHQVSGEKDGSAFFLTVSAWAEGK